MITHTMGFISDPTSSQDKVKGYKIQKLAKNSNFKISE